MTLDCGHEESAHSVTTRGYGTTADGKTYCYPCCHAMDLETMEKTGKITGYLANDGKTVTNWPGSPLLRVTREYETSAGGFARLMKITRVYATDSHGRTWSGRGPGRGMYMRLSRLK